jgi:hypothetical protein
VAIGYGLGGKAFWYNHKDKGFRPSASALAPAQWHQIHLTFDGRTFRFYVDGAQDGSAVSLGLLAGGEFRSKIGKYGDTPLNAFQGAIDEARVAGTARSAAWVKLDYESQRPGQQLLRIAP